jgi:RNAse (barnase) inhibitor barstar
MALTHIRRNIVQSIRAHRVSELEKSAADLGHYFFHADLANTQSREEVVAGILRQFKFPEHSGHNYDAIYDCLTAPVYKSAPQPGFVVVLEKIPTNPLFDKDARESLLDLFREASDYWGDRKIPFRCFYSFSVARAVGADEKVPKVFATSPEGDGEIMPTQKLVDISPQALRMSSPFNAGYWLASLQEGANAQTASS